VLECSSPAVADGKLFLRLKTAVACYDLTKGPVDPSSALSVSYEGPGIAKSQIPSQTLFRDAD